MTDALAGRTIVVPERRELDLFARMLEQHGAITIRCPMVAISDVPDAAPVVTWLRRFTTDPPDDLILMTGEGLGRLVGFARRAGLEGGVHVRARQGAQDHARPEAGTTPAVTRPAAGFSRRAADNGGTHCVPFG